MEKILAISKEKPDEKSMDYAFLRDEGFKHIENLGSKIWTDYNVHDPGISILEVLCYAITDLGYRTSFDIKDLLAEPDDSANPQQFFTAKEVLICNPVTETDFRKVIIDTDQVKNAWIYVAESADIEKKGDPHIYLDCEHSQLKTNGTDEHIIPLRGLYKILLELDDDIDLDDTVIVDQIKNEAAEKLHNVRNLCEDFLCIEVVGIEKISLCADIEVTTEADIEEVLAEIYFRIQQFISPPLNFYTLEEMLDKGKKSEEIFDGPFLEHGFIDTEELEASILPKELHVSDLYRKIMQVPGIKSIKKLYVQRYDSSDQRVDSKEWCLQLNPPELKAQLSTDLSSITFYKGIIPLFANKEKVQEKFELKLGMSKKPYITSDANDFKIPTGTYHELKDYTSIQEEFPLTYGIGREGLPDSASDLRKAQAKQLKAYLSFFDQVLANYLAQLSGVKDLLSVHHSDDRTYFEQSLADTLNIKELLVNGTDPGSDHYYFTDLKKFMEDEHSKWDRRNRFLDHLMARFGEKFNDYALLMYDIYGNKVNENLVEDKEDFLKDYPVISRDRGKAFNYKSWNQLSDQPDVWNTFNVSGLEARIARLLGVDDSSRRHLYCKPVYKVEVYRVTSGEFTDKYRYRLRAVDNEILLISDDVYEERSASEEKLNLLKIQVLKEENYKIKTIGTGYRLFIQEDNGTDLVRSKKLFDSNIEAAMLKETILRLVCPEEGCGEEGFHLVEHLLLRPHNTDYSPLPINVNCDSCTESADPYSFRMSIVLPFWPERFKEWTFRKFIEETIRKETPAHIAIKICWVSCLQMRAFEGAYKAWLEEKAKKAPDKDNLETFANELIKILFSLRSIYPKAKLHDCRTSEEALILGHSTLGKL